MINNSIKRILDDAFIPNRKMRQDKWAQELDTQNAFTSNIDENIVSDKWH